MCTHYRITHDTHNILFKFQLNYLQIKFNFNLIYLISKINILNLYIGLDLIFNQFVYVYIELYIYIYICTHTLKYMYTHIYLLIHTSIYTYIILWVNFEKSLNTCAGESLQKFSNLICPTLGNFSKTLTCTKTQKAQGGISPHALHYTIFLGGCQVSMS